MRRIPWVLLGFVLLALLTRYVKVNAMASLPYGAYWLASLSHPLSVGTIVTVQTPETLALMRRLHGSLVATWPILKPVAAVAGERVCRQGDGLRIRGEDWGRIYAVAPDGQPLPSWLAPDECQSVKTGDVFLASAVDGSLDSRYVGPVPMTALHTEVIPLLTWRP